MLREILSVAGRQGLFKLLSSNKQSFIVESLIDKRRMPVYASDRVVSLGEIAIFTETGEMPLGEVLDKLYAHTDGKQIDIKAFGDKQALFDYFAEVLPDFDRLRVYPTDIKKLLTWYNLLVENGFEKFARVEEPTEEKVEESEEPQEKE